MKRGSFFGRLSNASDLPNEEDAHDDVVVMERPEAPQSVTAVREEPAEEPAAPQATIEAPAPEAPAATPLASTATSVSLTNEAETQEDEWDAEVEGQLTIDVYQTADSIVIKSTIAGVSNEDLDISIDNDMVTIQGERRTESSVEEKDYYYQECYWGSFSRSVILPCDVKADEADAELKNGILTIVLPKANTTRAKKIQVK